MDLVEMDNGLKFMVLSSHVLDGNKYLFLVSVSDDPEYLFAEFFDGGKLVPVEDEEIIKKLLELAANKVENFLDESAN